MNNRVRDLIRASDLTYREISEKTGIPLASVHVYATKNMSIPPERLEALAKALGVNAPYLIGWTDEPSPHINIKLNTLSQINEKVFWMFGALGAEEKEQVLDYISFLLEKKNKK